MLRSSLKAAIMMVLKVRY